MATPIPLLGYGLGPIPIPALPLALGEINGRGVGLWVSLVAVLGLLLVSVLLRRELMSTPGRSGHGDS
jgi:hypothetical protein